MKSKAKLLSKIIFAMAMCFTAIVNAQTNYKFAFGTEQPGPGWTQVSPTNIYSADAGFGFEPGANLIAGTNSVGSDTPFYFSAKEPEGNYKVTVMFGGEAASTTTVKAELRRLMVEKVQTDAGKSETRTFIVNLRTPDIAGGGVVKLKMPRETTAEAWAWDDKLTLEFNNSHPSIESIAIEKADVPTVFILGDSTVCDQSGEPYCSWGQMLPRFFKPDVAIANHAESGESVASSTGAGRLNKVLSLMKPGDYLFIQYGHNDMKATTPEAYEAQLKTWLAQVREKGGTPVLITPMNRHSFEDKVVTNSLRGFPDAVRDLAKQENVALIDLNAMSKTLYETFGPYDSINLFEHRGNDLSKFDPTHFCNFGAYELAKCIVEGIKSNKLPLAKSLVTDVPVFDPAKPDAVADFKIPASPHATMVRPLGN